MRYHKMSFHLCYIIWTMIETHAQLPYTSYVQPKRLTEPKIMSLSLPGLHIEQHINEGRTLNSFIWS